MLCNTLREFRDYPPPEAFPHHIFYWWFNKFPTKHPPPTGLIVNDDSSMNYNLYKTKPPPKVLATNNNIHHRSRKWQSLSAQFIASHLESPHSNPSHFIPIVPHIIRREFHFKHTISTAFLLSTQIILRFALQQQHPSRRQSRAFIVVVFYIFPPDIKYLLQLRQNVLRLPPTAGWWSLDLPYYYYYYYYSSCRWISSFHFKKSLLFPSPSPWPSSPKLTSETTLPIVSFTRVSPNPGPIIHPPALHTAYHLSELLSLLRSTCTPTQKQIHTLAPTNLRCHKSQSTIHITKHAPLLTRTTQQ